jgi:hypothetical protein
MQNKTSFAPEQLGASAERALHFIDAAGARAPELVEEWIKAGNAAAVQAAAEQAQGAARKAARRGLNVLKARGVNIPSVPRLGRLQPSASGGREAWLLPPDNTGAEGVVLAERQESGSYHVSFVFFRHGQNLLRVHNGHFGLARIKQNMQDTLGSAGPQAVSVPWAWAQFRIAERKAWHQTNSVPEPLGMTGVGRFLVDAPSESPTHPFDARDWNLTDEEVQRLAADSGVLHQWPEFGSWLPGERAIQELLMQIGRRLGPTPPTAQEQIDPIIVEQVAAATDRYFTPERRALLAERMRDSGLSVLARLGEDAARRVAAVVRVIQDAGLITNPPSNVRFLTAYFDKALSLLMAQGGGQLRVPVPAAVQGSVADGPGNAGASTEPLETHGGAVEAAPPGA